MSLLAKFETKKSIFFFDLCRLSYFFKDDRFLKQFFCLKIIFEIFLKVVPKHLKKIKAVIRTKFHKGKQYSWKNEIFVIFSTLKTAFTFTSNRLFTLIAFEKIDSIIYFCSD